MLNMNYRSRLTDLKLCMLVNIFGSLPVEDKLGLIGNSDNMIFHGVTQESETNETHQY